MATRIAIIGAGPAGTATALALVDRGVAPEDVVLFDSATFPRPKLCGGGITARGTRALSALAGRPPGGHETDALELRSPHGSVTARETSQQWLFDRSYLDNYLLEKCRECGVEVRTSCRITSLRRNGRWQVGWDGGSAAFSWVVGADGAHGGVRRMVGLHPWRLGRLVEGIYEEVEVGQADDRALVMDFEPVRNGIPGYAWIFPYPRPNGPAGLWKIGLMDGRGSVEGATLRNWTQRFAERNGFRLAEDRVRGWPAHFYSPTTRAHLPGLLLVGEAWGIDPLLGEGIAPSLLMARYAAKRLKSALDRDRDTVDGYERRFTLTAEGHNLAMHDLMAETIFGPTGEAWLEIIFDLPGFEAVIGGGTVDYCRLYPTWLPAALAALMQRTVQTGPTAAWRRLREFARARRGW